MVRRKTRRQEMIETFKTVIYAVLIAVFIRTVAFEPFNIPSGSMIPNLLVGDHLFVSKYSYGYSRHSMPYSFPLFKGRLFFKEPKRGDVIVFKVYKPKIVPYIDFPVMDMKTGKTPVEKLDYIKRLIGLPGDRVQIKNGRLYINGKIVARRFVGEYTYPDITKGIMPSASKQQMLYEETLPDGPTYAIIEETDGGPLDNTKEFVVPQGHYFMMGDNRDNSADSRDPRSYVGFVPAENLVGKGQILFFSHNGYARIWEFWRWFKAIRYDRVFVRVK